MTTPSKQIANGDLIFSGFQLGVRLKSNFHSPKHRHQVAVDDLLTNAASGSGPLSFLLL